eukprot:7388022-Prymnesium_polylepis.1
MLWLLCWAQGDEKPSLQVFGSVDRGEVCTRQVHTDLRAGGRGRNLPSHRRTAAPRGRDSPPHVHSPPHTQ